MQIFKWYNNRHRLTSVAHLLIHADNNIKEEKKMKKNITRKK